MLWPAVFGGCCQWLTARQSRMAFPTPSRPLPLIYWKTLSHSFSYKGLEFGGQRVGGQQLGQQAGIRHLGAVDQVDRHVVVGPVLDVDGVAGPNGPRCENSQIRTGFT